ncbi:rhomboid family intramembrane serine protease [Microvirga sp. CF3062]|uniref:rhomboid family intramembrane serine protease n=1 Tax=Microvirga sp. CF3062 TaxID=3110182 RepID=UPI002E782906|nr:rhomboid family intramembrane serine protease [Microvirga sp. CF3062]MEE1655542.1 rhomboid family intramembrane serine protease [Microvirga sp. CF3062]
MDQASLSEFGLYFGQYHQAKKGFQLGAPPEARELEEVSDYVLTLFDGFNVQIYCVIDYEAHPDRTFELPLETVVEIGERCKAHTRRIFANKGYVFISLIELGRAPSPERREHLSRYRKNSLFSKVRVMAFTIEQCEPAVWTNASAQGGLQRRAFLALLQKPRLSRDELVPRQVAVRQAVFPWAAAALAAFLAGVFMLEMAYGIGPGEKGFAPSLRTLVGFGGLLKTAVENGEWYRFFLAPILHGNAFHLLLNLVALFLAGRVFERLSGWVWFLATFALSALGGALGSLLWIGDGIVTVGASGGISGLLAAGFVSTLRLPVGAERTRFQIGLLAILIPGLLPHLPKAGSMSIDLGSHIGGAVTGALVGFFLIRNWSVDRHLPAFRMLAAGIVAVSLAALGASSLAAREGYRQQKLALHLVPDDEMPKNDAEWISRSEALVGQYPRDPRVRVARAIGLVRTLDLPEAERELQEGLSQEEILRILKPELAISARAILALVLHDQNKPEARAVAALVCDKAPEGMVKAMRQRALCP